jgi:hypothetical protein
MDASAEGACQIAAGEDTENAGKAHSYIRNMTCPGWREDKGHLGSILATKSP